MKVECDTLDDFLANLEAENSGKVYKDTIYVNKISSPLDNQDKRKAVRFLVVLRVSTIIDMGDGEYLLNMEEECGIDYNDASQEKEGTEVCDVKEKRLKEFCECNGLKIRPGVVDF